MHQQTGQEQKNEISHRWLISIQYASLAKLSKSNETSKSYTNSLLYKTEKSLIDLSHKE